MPHEAFNRHVLPSWSNTPPAATTRDSGIRAAALKASYEYLKGPDTRVLQSEDDCPSKSRVIDAILAKLAMKV